MPEAIRLYVWDNSVFVLAQSVEEATCLAAARVREMPSLLQVVREKTPVAWSYPSALIPFHSPNRESVSEPGERSGQFS